jgi:hypothetical protein
LLDVAPDVGRVASKPKFLHAAVATPGRAILPDRPPAPRAGSFFSVEFTAEPRGIEAAEVVAVLLNPL